jgi:hypothetical protein
VSLVGVLRVTYKTGFGFDDWIYWHLIHSQLGTTGNCRAIANFHTLQFTVTHALGFSVFASCILTTDLWQSHYHFKSHMKSSLHSLFPSCHYSRLRSIPLLPSLYPGKLSSRNSTFHSLLLSWIILYNHTARTPRNTPYCILFYVCLPHHCIATVADNIENSLSIVEACLP